MKIGVKENRINTIKLHLKKCIQLPPYYLFEKANLSFPR